MERSSHSQPMTAADEEADLRLRTLEPFTRSFETLLQKSRQRARLEFHRRKVEIMRELIKSFSRLNKTAPVNERSIKSLLSPNISIGAMDLGRTPDDSQLVLREVFGGFMKRGAPLELELSEDEDPGLSKFKGSLKKIRRN